MQDDSAKHVLDVAHVADELGVLPVTVRRWLDRGLLKAAGPTIAPESVARIQHVLSELRGLFGSQLSQSYAFEALARTLRLEELVADARFRGE